MLYEFWLKLDNGKAYCKARSDRPGELRALADANGWTGFLVKQGEALPERTLKAHPDGRLLEPRELGDQPMGPEELDCKGKKKDGSPCTRKTLNGNGYCYQHQDQA